MIATLLPSSTFAKDCGLLHNKVRGQYTVALEDAYARAVDKFCAVLKDEVESVEPTHTGFTAWQSRVKIVLDDAREAVSGWTVTLEQEKKYLSPLEKLGETLKNDVQEEVVSQLSCFISPCHVELY